MYNILQSIFWYLKYDMNLSKDQLYKLVYYDTNCTPEEFDKAYVELYKAYTNTEN